MGSADALSNWAQRYPELALLFNPNGSVEDHDKALERLIDQAVRWLEDNANDLNGAKENLLSTTLAGKISMPGLRADREKNTNGHVDITIEIEHSYPQRRWLAEAKCWNGPKYHVEGMAQLLDRYETGRDRTGYVFDYVQESGIEGKWIGLRTHLDKERPLEQEKPCEDHSAIWVFQTHHKHRSGRSIRVVHYGVNLG
ncbi:MAG TPA: hypothetical protein VI457_05005 [Methylococcaceae bacterium]|nr:hypothetical protein [Methylococcaceae bacterium]